MAQGVGNQPTVSVVSDRFEPASMEIGGNTKDAGQVAEAVIEINSEEKSSSSAQVTKSEVDRDDSAVIKVLTNEPEIVISVDQLRSSDSLRQADQGTSGCLIDSSKECLSQNCLKNSSETDSIKNVSGNEKDSSAIAIRRSETSRSVDEDSEDEKVCRICHLSSEQPLDTNMYEEYTSNPAASELIQLGCGCKDELGIAHSLCAEAWFKLKGNRLCEICGETARNISGVWDDRFIDKWNDRLSTSSNMAPQRGGCWRGQPFCNFLMACLVIAFVLPWFFRVKMF